MINPLCNFLLYIRFMLLKILSSTGWHYVKKTDKMIPLNTHLTVVPWPCNIQAESREHRFPLSDI